ncbi:FMN-binding protein [Roseateles sp. NT4]|uniref:FMN-binding protein n=1 Tax=Roseateles sp. NT4 TaxID=3453715 RepID=UPI003EE8BD8A
MTPLNPWLVPVALCAPLQAFAVQYLTVEAAQQLMFPAATEFKPRALLLTAAQRETIARAAGTPVRTAEVRCWEARGASGVLGLVLVDEVIGKHEFITYAVALKPDGSVLQVEILDYRETYGGQVRQPAWRAQFVGKTAADAVRIDKNIQNLAGATLSSVHVTDGIRRLLTTYELALRTSP